MNEIKIECHVQIHLARLYSRKLRIQCIGQPYFSFGLATEKFAISTTHPQGLDTIPLIILILHNINRHTLLKIIIRRYFTFPDQHCPDPKISHSKMHE